VYVCVRMSVIEVGESVVADEVEDVKVARLVIGGIVRFSVDMRRRMVPISGYEEERNFPIQ
jgi:hypothetical protein